ncbi:ECF transporter S component [Streptococcaceae bacterium ESL0687]|nr:ECF transporter S component [Streptococcaceae bacterium ESL0687]
MKKNSASNIAILSILLASMIVINVLTQIIFTVWPFPIRPTLIHIPVIIGSVILGPKKGAFLGFSMGVISSLTLTIITTPTSFLFTPLQPLPGTNHGDLRSLLIAFVPRILIGIIPYYVFKAFKKHPKFGAGLAGCAGSLTNTILVLSAIYFMFGDVLGWSLKTVLASIVGTNSIAEAICSTILTAAIVPTLMKIKD